MRDAIVGVALGVIVVLLAAQLVVELVREDKVAMDDPISIVSSEESPLWTNSVAPTDACFEASRASLTASTDLQEAYFDAMRDPDGTYPMGFARAANEAYMHAREVCSETE